MGLNMSELIQKFDLYGIPFNFRIGNTFKKRTNIGGYISLAIIAISIVYFYYLMSLYFNNKVEPKIIRTNSIATEALQINFNDNFFYVGMIYNGKPLSLYEQQVNKKFVNIQIYRDLYFINGTNTSSFEEIPMQLCKDKQFEGYYCIPQDTFKSNRSIYLDPITNEASEYEIMIFPCEPKEQDNCASKEEIEKVVYDPLSFLSVLTKIQQYNPNYRQFVTEYKGEYFQFDPEIFITNRISLIEGHTKINEGFIVQDTKEINHVIDYKRIDNFTSRRDLYIRKEGQEYVYGYIIFDNGCQEKVSVLVQHAMITEILAQFMSVFNTLLIVGILTRLLAESHIDDDINDVLLKNQYKKTALRLVNRKKQKETVKKLLKINESIKDGSQTKVKELKSIMLQQQKDQQVISLNSQNIVQLQSQIQKTRFSQKIKNFFDISLWEKIKIFFQIKLGILKKENQKEVQTASMKRIYQGLIQQTIKKVNILEVFKELIKLKMAIKVILTKEQYAALHFCGSDLPDYCQQENNDIKRLIERIKTIGQKSPCQNNNFTETPRNNISNMLSLRLPDKTDRNSKNKEFESIEKLTNTQIKALDQQPETNSNLNKISDLLNFNTLRVKSQSQFLQNQSVGKSKHFEEDKKYRQFYFIHSSTSENNTQIDHNIRNVDIRDNILVQKIEGDQENIDESFISVEENNNKQIKINKNSIIYSVDQGNFNIKFNSNNMTSHMQQMDKIEEDIKEQEKYLNQFLLNVEDALKSNRTQDINHIDYQIYQSLYVNDFNQDNDYQNIPEDLLLSNNIFDVSKNLGCQSKIN